MSHLFASGEREGYIMVVEDSKSQAMMLKSLLKKHDYKVRDFEDGLSAFNAAMEEPPILIVSDIVMPGMDGYELCEKVKNTKELKEIPIILLTTLQDSMDIIKGLQAGSDNFITKPFDAKYLLSRINYLLANRELRYQGTSDLVLEIMFNGQKYAINSERKQILDLLLSVYENAIQQNHQLIEAQAELRRSNEHLITMNRDLEAFSYTISHDLRTPLNHISMSAQLLHQHYLDKLDEAGASYVDTIHSTTKSMAEMINDLLQFSRTGTINIHPQPIDLSEMCRKVMQWIHQDSPDRKIDVKIDDNLQLTGDQSLLMVVVKNLLGNSWKYTSKTNHPAIHVSSFQKDGQTVFTFKDNGAGFDPLRASNLFTPFVRLHSQEDFPGTGVGLATAKRIIERHGGRIWAEGEIGKGATFSFYIGQPK
ncbi:MAG: response regulator [Bacteroidetes bacterium]|nr:response regulator [Bacteroidota bacterium]